MSAKAAVEIDEIVTAVTIVTVVTIDSRRPKQIQRLAALTLVLAFTAVTTVTSVTIVTRRYGATVTEEFGKSPNISGAYIASTRVGGSSKRPALFSRKVYSTTQAPLGTKR